MTREERYAALCKDLGYRYPEDNPKQFAIVSWENEASEVRDYDTAKEAMASLYDDDGTPEEIVDLDTGLRCKIKTTYTTEGWE